MNRSPSPTTTDRSERRKSSDEENARDDVAGRHRHHRSHSTDSHVSFGRVSVHQHRMTLGTNPSVTNGIPVELCWEAESSYESELEDYERMERRKPGRLSPQTRREIAEEHHSRESIFATLKEASLIRHAIEKSLEYDDDDDSIISEASLYVENPSDPPRSPCPTPRNETEKIQWSKRLCERMQAETARSSRRLASPASFFTIIIITIVKVKVFQGGRRRKVSVVQTTS